MEVIKIFNRVTNAVLGEFRDIVHGNANLGQMVENYNQSGGSTTNQEVTVEEAMTIPAVEASVELITSSIAKLPIKLYREDRAKEVKEVRDDRRIFLLNNEPNNIINGHNFKKQIVEDYLFYGGSYVKVDKTPTGKWLSLHLLDPQYITRKKYVRSGYLVDVEYLYDHPDYNSTVTFKKDELLVVLKNSRDGVSGRGILEQGQNTLRLAINEVEYAKGILENGALPLGMLQTDQVLTKPAMERLRESFDSAYQGAKNVGKTIILENGLSYKPVSLKPNELDLGGSKKATISNIARLFGVPESMINSDANKYASTEQNNIHFLQYCIAPIITSIESAFNKSLLKEVEKTSKYKFVVDTADILQTTEKEKIEAVGQGLDKGLFTINEARRKLNLTDITTSDYYMTSQGKIFIDKDTGMMTIPNLGRIIDPNKIDKAQLVKSDITKLEKLLNDLKDPDVNLEDISFEDDEVTVNESDEDSD